MSWLVSVVIVNYNTGQLTCQAIESLLKYYPSQTVKLEIIVVDNASTDDSVEQIKKQFPQIRILLNQQNVGFAKANNQAIKQAQGEYVLLFNSDAYLISAGVVEEMITASREWQEAVVVPRLVYPDGRPQPSVYRLPSLRRAIQYALTGQAWGPYLPQAKQAVAVEAAVMAVMLIPKSVGDQVGWLDERFFMYFEDMHFCRQLRQQQVPLVYLPQVQVAHLLGQSSQQSPQSRALLRESSLIYHGKQAWLVDFWLNLARVRNKLLSGKS